MIQPLAACENAHNGEVIEDVSWNQIDPSVFYSVGDDRSIHVWDRRDLSNGPVNSKAEAHTAEIMCVDACPFDANAFLTGSMDS